MKRCIMAVTLCLLAVSCTLAQDAPKPDKLKDAPAAKDASGKDAATQPAAKAALPVSKIVLFSSGVGYFEHDGSVEGSAVATLNFRVDEINDILKSMVLMDFDKGTVSSVTYPSRDPLAHALKSFGVDISGDPTLADLLRQLRGAEATVTAPNEISGKILGVETKKKEVLAAGGTTIITESYLNLVTDKGLQSIPMSSVQNVTLKNAKLSEELNKALELLIESRDASRKPVEVHFAGNGKRHVRVGYINETPVWKTTYRLDFSPKTPLIQGWAIVENTSDQDWKDVDLSLVSGRPISFVQDLYTPLYMRRPVVMPELYASLVPQVYEEGFGRDKGKGGGGGGGDLAAKMEKKEKALEDMNAALGATPARARAGGMTDGPRPSAPPSEVTLDSVQALASGGKVGELFQFSIKDKVDLPRRRSAMLPIINQGIKAERVSIYNERVMPKNPLNGAVLTNDTGMKLLGGPITVFDGGTYAGDARMDNLVPNDKRLISYAIDLNMSVDPSVKTADQIVGFKIVRGALEIKRLATWDQTYLIKNKADQDRVLIIEQPFVNGRDLVEPVKFEEKTPAMYRFRVSVPKAEKDKETELKFVVTEKQELFSAVGILEESVQTLLGYAKTGKLGDKVAKALAEAVRLKNEMGQSQNALADLQRQLAALTADQARLVKNLEAVGKDSELGKRYLTNLSKDEDGSEAINGQIKELIKKIADQRKALEDYLRDLNVE